MSEVIAILTADLHLSQRPTIARSAEPDWFAAMARPLRELRDLAESHKAVVICAGDIFDRYNASPELINWAIDNLPKMYAVSGQHDQPHHNLDDMHRSAYQTLVKAGIIEGLSDQMEWVDGLLGMVGFSWGVDIISKDELGILNLDARDTFSIAVAHSYVYSNKTNSYPGAPKENYFGAYKSKLKGYDVAVFGDNHIGFLAKSGDCNVINCGSLIRRSIDEKDRRPFVGLLYDDGSIDQHFLDTSKDKWIEMEDVVGGKDVGECAELIDFLDELEGLSSDSLDFREAIKRYIEDEKVSERTKGVILEAMGE